MDIKKKVAYILPGYGQSSVRGPAYIKIAKFFEARGIKPISVKIEWRKNKPEKFSEYVQQFLKQYKKQKNTLTYVLGFSYGANIALLAAPKAKPNMLILCSLSPYFEEDLKTIKSTWFRWWRKNFIESDYSFDKLAQKIKNKTTLLIGEHEDISSIKRAKDAKRKLLDSRLIAVKNGLHKIGQKEYIKAVEKVVSTL